MELLTPLSQEKPEIKFDYDLARSFMSERSRIYSDAIDSLIVDRALTKVFGDLAERIGPMNPTLDKEEEIRTLLLEDK